MAETAVEKLCGISQFEDWPAVAANAGVEVGKGISGELVDGIEMFRNFRR